MHTDATSKEKPTGSANNPAGHTDSGSITGAFRRIKADAGFVEYQKGQPHDLGNIAQALEWHNVMAGLPALVAGFGCGIAHDLEHMTLAELSGLYAHLMAIKRGQA
jgi:hypothetical protein